MLTQFQKTIPSQFSVSFMRSSTRCLLLAFLYAVFSVSLHAQVRIEKVAELTGFSSNNKELLVKYGSNIELSRKFIQSSSSMLELNLSKKTMNDQPDLNWFFVEQPVKADAKWKGAEGVAVNISLNRSMRWWFSFDITDKSGNKYSFYPLQPMDYTSKSEQRLVPFNKFKSKQTKSILKPENIAKIRISGTGNTGVVRLSNVFLYQKASSQQWLEVATESRYGGSIFQRDEPVLLIFKTVDLPTPQPTEFSYVVSDFDQKKVAQGTVKLTPGQKLYKVALDLKQPGYYEVRAYGGDKEGGSREISCVKQRGSIPGNFATFAIMPNTVKENVTRMLDVGEEAFFGLHNPRHYLNLHELMGFPWMFAYSRWQYIEPQKPKRKSPDASAPWVEKRYKETGPLPAYIFAHTSLLSAQTGAPKWAQSNDMLNPPHYKNEKDLMLFLRDYVRYHKLLCPHMKHRTYGILWEPEIHTPKYRNNIGHVPIYKTQQELVEIQKKTKALIKKEDPDSIVIGPTSMWCYGLDWWDRFFQAGILDHVDQLSTHLYCSAPPENNSIPEKLASIRELMKKYKGKVFDIYNTETGFKSKIGNQHKLIEHAGWSVRYCMIMKGEGLKRHLHFYPFDITYKGDWDTYGICFYLGDFEKYDFNTLKFSPKPAVCALATCSSELLGATPRRHLRDWGRNVWGYVFERKGKPIIALWQPAKKITTPVVVGDVDQVEITDIMGRKTVKKVEGGLVTLEIGPNPIYINGAEESVYLSPELTSQDALNTQLPVVIPGQSRVISLPPQAANDVVKQVRTWGGISAEIEGDKLKVKVAPGTPEMAAPVLIQYASKKTYVQWIYIGGELKLEAMAIASEGGKMGLKVTLRNHTKEAKAATLSMVTALSSKWTTLKTTVPAEACSSTFMPFNSNIKLSDSTYKPLNIELQVKPEKGPVIEEERKIYFLSAYKQTQQEKIFPDQVQLEGKGASGKNDHADIRFSWNKDSLILSIKVRDDINHQQEKDHGKLWAEDSIQLAFDTHPDKAELYNPLAGVYDKKVTEMTVGKTNGKEVVYRHITHNPAELPEGDVSNAGFNVVISRDEKTMTTDYSIQIPWEQLGLQGVQKGKSIGISILINDYDGKGTKRACIPLFGGILHGKDYNLFGRLTLR